MEIFQTQNGIFVCQMKYIREMLKTFSMKNSKLVSTPLVLNLKLMKDDGTKKIDEVYRIIVGCLLYLTSIRPDITFAANILFRFRQEPSELHFQAAKRVLKYVKGIKELGIWFKNFKRLLLTGFTDSDWVGSVDDMKSTSGYVFYASSSIVCWNSMK